MVRRMDRPVLRVPVSFEATRTGPQPESHEPAGRVPAQADGPADAGRAMHWHALHDPRYACQSRLCRTRPFGRARYLPPQPRLRPIRGHPQPSPRATCRVLVPPEEWIEIPVPPLVDRTMFETARAQLEENGKRKRQRMPGADWLLQGLTVCRRCGYPYYVKRAPSSRKDDPTNTLRYYRCIGADGYRLSGHAVCNNPAVGGDHLEESVWDQVAGRCRRLAKHWEKSIASAEARIYGAHIRLLTRRLARA